jgi:nitroreductase
MDVFEAIFTRQSVSKMRSDPVPQEMIERLLAAANQAPNHYRTRPWRFVVVEGQARFRLGEVMLQAYLRRQPDAGPSAIEKERSRPLRAPVLIAVGVDLPAEPKVIEIENVCAAAAAVQNMLLAARALGIGAMWRTGPSAYEPDVKAFFGLQPEQHLIGFVYIGWPEKELEAIQRPSFEDRTVWIRQ